MQSRNVACRVCRNVLLTACHLVARKRYTSIVVVLSLLASVYVAVWCYISASKSPSLWGVVSNTPTPTATNPAGAWRRNVNESVIEVDVDGNFSDRVARFNVELNSLRQQLRLNPAGIDVSRTTCSISGNLNHTANSVLGARRLRVVWGAKENYIDELSNNPDIVTVVLPWLGSRSNWSSVTDFSNVLYQRYFDWTADNVLCSIIETPGLTKRHFNIVYNRICNRNVNNTTQGQSLRPLYLNGKPKFVGWKFKDYSYPEHFYTTPPPYVFYVHIHRYAVVTEVGDVITANTKLVLYACSNDIKPTSPLLGNLSRIPCYDEVYLITHHRGNDVFHRMVEIVPRLALCLQFLNAHPEIRILAPQVGGRLAELLEVIGLDKSRLLTGPTRANIVYQPRATGCGFANVQESQTLSKLYHDYIERTFPPQRRNKLILIRRSGSRKFTKQKAIEKALQRAAIDYNLTYTLFIDNPTPSLANTMMTFHSAVIIVAPHGAGLSNMLFSQPGTYIVEAVCEASNVRLCFQLLGHILGHHWHGITSRGGCHRVIDVSAETVDDAVRSYLRLWMLERSS